MTEPTAVFFVYYFFNPQICYAMVHSITPFKIEDYTIYMKKFKKDLYIPFYFAV